MLLRQTHVTDRNRIPRAPIRSCLALMLLCGVMQSASAGVNCQPLDLPPISAFESGGTSASFSIFSTQTSAVGGTDPDYFDFMFFNAGNQDTGTSDLGAAPDDNYATCERCLQLCMDVNQSTFDCDKWFFQSAGTIVVNAPPEDGALDVTVSGLRVVESVVDPDTFESTPVPGGQCFDLSFSQHIFQDGFEQQLPLMHRTAD